ncbi:MAG: hypothetical protein AB7G11_12290 [Phycisphaerales bacterium]
MTTVQTMLCAAAIGAVLLTGCAREKEVLVNPNVIQSPYPASKGETVWAIAPLTNESGVSTIDTLALSDALAAAVAEVSGISALPVNRSLAAMSAHQLRAIRSPRDAKVLADALKAGGVIVGSITAYDPYDPPKIGLTLALYTTDREPGEPIDPRILSSAYADRSLPRGTNADDPAAFVSEHLDAASHEVLIALREFAHGRHDPSSSLSWKRYTASMELYTEFAAYHCVRKLVQSERRRLASGSAGNPASPPATPTDAMTVQPTPTLTQAPTSQPQ